MNSIKYLLIFLIGTLLGCSSETRRGHEASCDTLTFVELKTQVLGKNINSLPSFNCFVPKDTLLEGDEGVQWKAKAYYFEKQLAFLAETSWEDNKKIIRVTILDSVIRDNELFVGQQFRSIKHLVSTEIPTAPDGYFFLLYDKDKDIQIQLDISGGPTQSPLFYGVTDIDQIPPNLAVESIVIMK
jgi:hypothetical protein